MKLIHIFGAPNAGKTTLRDELARRHPEMQSYCIDDFRKIYSDGTLEGEMSAQAEFKKAMKKGGFFECSGAGAYTVSVLLDFLNEEQYIIVLDTPVDVCISRIREGKYDGIPFPFHGSNEDFIRNVTLHLSSGYFMSLDKNIPMLRLKGLSLEEQVCEVERFTDLCQRQKNGKGPGTC